MGTSEAARPCGETGRTPSHPQPTEILNGIFYAVRSGCAWKLLPHDLPPWRTVLSLLLVMAPQRDMAGDSRQYSRIGAASSGSTSGTERCGRRQPISTDH